MAEDVSIHINVETISVDTQNLTPAAVFDWLSALQWWEWLFILKFCFILWVFNVTVILPSLYMQVMLYTDEMTSRQQNIFELPDALAQLMVLTIAKYSAMQKKKEFKHYWLDKIEKHYKRLHKKRRKKTC